MNSREERNRRFFDEDQLLLPDISADSWTTENHSNEPNDQFWEPVQQQQKQESVLLQIEEAETAIKQAAEREQEVGHIVQSIADLNYIFKVINSILHFFVL